MPEQTGTAVQPAPTTPQATPDLSPATDAALLALKIATGDRRLPVIPSTENRATVLAEIHTKQATAAWQQLLRRYSTLELRTRDLNLALIQAGRWATDLTALRDGAPVDELAHAALVAALARRLIIDGPQCAQATVTACTEAITAMPSTSVPAPRDRARRLTTAEGT